MANNNGSVESTATTSLGLLASLQQLLATSVEVLRTRVELVSTELAEEGVRVREIFFLQQASLFFLGMSLLLTTLFVLLIFWDSHRLAALASFSVLYLVAGVSIGWILRSKLRNHPGLFSTSRDELRKDRERLQSRS